MARDPFVWEVQLREDVIDDAVAEFHRLPYSVIRDIIDLPLHKAVTSRDAKKYTLSVQAA